mgnify:CR=1 FL=1
MGNKRKAAAPDDMRKIKKGRPAKVSQFCNACHQTKAVRCYSTNQLKDVKRARCVECINSNAPLVVVNRTKPTSTVYKSREAKQDAVRLTAKESKKNWVKTL